MRRLGVPGEIHLGRDRARRRLRIVALEGDGAVSTAALPEVGVGREVGRGHEVAVLVDPDRVLRAPVEDRTVGRAGHEADPVAALRARRELSEAAHRDGYVRVRASWAVAVGRSCAATEPWAVCSWRVWRASWAASAGSWGDGAVGLSSLPRRRTATAADPAAPRRAVDHAEADDPVLLRTPVVECEPVEVCAAESSGGAGIESDHTDEAL